MSKKKYNHAEAFCVMTYQSDDGTITEQLWNSRDGVTPFMIMSRNGGRELRHIDWGKDYPQPNYKPLPGKRIFVDATRELVTPKLNEYVEKIFTEHDGGYWKTREEAFEALLPGWLHNGEEPWIIVVGME
jgi:hypothetical protein